MITKTKLIGLLQAGEALEVYNETNSGREIVEGIAARWPARERVEVRSKIYEICAELVESGEIDNLGPDFEPGQWVRIKPEGLMQHLVDEGLGGVTARIERVYKESLSLEGVDWPINKIQCELIEEPTEGELIAPPPQQEEGEALEDAIQAIYSLARSEETVEAEIIQSMSEAEARLCVEGIKQGFVNLRRQIWELYEREGWKALGYKSFRQCILIELEELSESRVYRELYAAQMESIFLPIGEIGATPESIYRPLKELPQDQQAKALLLARQLTESDNGIPTAEEVRNAVLIFKSPKQTNSFTASPETRERVTNLVQQEEDNPTEAAPPALKKGDRVLLTEQVADVAAGTEGVILSCGQEHATVQFVSLERILPGVSLGALAFHYSPPSQFNDPLLDKLAENLARAGVKKVNGKVMLRHLALLFQTAIEWAGKDEEWQDFVIEEALDKEFIPGAFVDVSEGGEVIERIANQVKVRWKNQRVSEFEAEELERYIQLNREDRSK